MAEMAAGKILEDDPGDASVYVTLSNKTRDGLKTKRADEV